MKQKIFFFLLFVQSAYGYTLQFHYNKDFNTHVILPSFLQHMCAAFDRSIFVETGTYLGEATEIAAAIFSQAHSVEVSGELYKGACERLKSIPNIHLYHDHSVSFLDSFCSRFQSDNGSMLFWLDAHESGGMTTHYKDVITPLVDELQTLAHHTMSNAVILIDDIRCFGSLYKNNLIPAHQGYPSIQKICELLKAINPAYTCILYGDTLVAYDASKYNPSISPLAYACTYSRLYDGDGDFSEAIIEQEACIVDADADESAFFTRLYQVTLTHHDDFHSILWYGLLVAKTDPATAQKAFRDIIARGYTHWRIYWYLATSAYAGGDYKQALDAIQHVITSNPDYDPAQQLYKKIVDTIETH